MCFVCFVVSLFCPSRGSPSFGHTLGWLPASLGRVSLLSGDSARGNEFNHPLRRFGAGTLGWQAGYSRNGLGFVPGRHKIRATVAAGPETGSHPVGVGVPVVDGRPDPLDFSPGSAFCRMIALPRSPGCPLHFAPTPIKMGGFRKEKGTGFLQFHDSDSDRRETVSTLE